MRSGRSVARPALWKTADVQLLDAGALIVPFAFALDLAFGEPPNAMHPVAWFGRLAGAFIKRSPQSPPAAAFAVGFVLTAMSVTLAWLLGVGLQSLAARLSGGLAQGVLLALCLKPTFAVRALGEAGARLQAALERSDLTAARSALGWLCSRDPANLDESALSAAAIESVAENTSDSVVAPLFYYAIFGLPGAAAFRVVNTLDAMIGYRDEREWLGKVAARLDDILGFVPARLTGALLVFAGAGSRRGLGVMLRDAGRTASPNAGWPMAAMAGVLGVRLPKAGVYSLGDEGRDASPADIQAAWRRCRRVAWVAAALVVVVNLVCAAS